MDCPVAPSCGCLVKCNLFNTAASTPLLRLVLPSKLVLLRDAQPLPLYSHTKKKSEFLTWVWRNLGDLLVKYLDGRFNPFKELLQSLAIDKSMQRVQMPVKMFKHKQVHWEAMGRIVGRGGSVVRRRWG